MNLGSLPTRHAAYRPRHTALIFEDIRLDYRSLDERLNRVAHALRSIGLVRGDAVATILGNRLELLEIYWAAAKLGLVVVPLSPLLRGQALRTLIEDANAAVLVTEVAHAGAVDEIRRELHHVPDELYLLVDHDGRDGYRDYHALCEREPATAPTPLEIPPDAPYNIIYSSGTTGHPKGIVLTHQVRVLYGALFASTYRMSPASVVLHAGSLVFNGAFLTLMPAMYLGATYVLQRQFDPASFIEAIRRERVTHVVLVPSQIVALLSSPAFSPEALASLEMICTVGAPLHRVHKEELCEALPGRFYELYGLTEGFVTVLDRDDASEKLTSVGTPPPLFELRIERSDGEPAATGEVGEIIGRGPLLMAGYHGRPELTQQTIVDGWLRTGDLGYVDDDGYLHLVDRKKDLIISGGVNVYPRDIEEVIAAHPDVREVAVFGVPNETWGETPVAAVLPVRRGGLDPAQLTHWINDRVGAKFQRVRDVVVLDDFPRNTTGKVLRRALRDMYLAGGDGRGSARFVQANGVRLHYLRSGAGAPLVLLPGLTANAHVFGGLLRAGLADRCDVIRVDLRGRGLSDKPQHGYTVADHAADVLALLDALELEQVALCGHSYGALVALWLAAAHPDRVRRLVLMDIAGPTIVNPEVLRLVQPSIDRLDREYPSLDAYLARMRQQAHLDGAWCDDLALYHRADVELLQDGAVRPRTPRRVIHEVLAHGQREDWAEIIARGSAHALIVCAPGPYGPAGTAPIVLPSQTEELASALRHARIVQVPGNHLTMLFGAGARAITAAIAEFCGAPATLEPAARELGGEPSAGRDALAAAPRQGGAR
jgi:long-chain acyl-CoA synthetase